MVRYRYTPWDGSRTIRLDADKLFERLSDHLSSSDLGDALERLLREGFEDRSFRVAGLDEILEDIRNTIQDLYDRFNLDGALAEHRELLDDVVSAERGRSSEPSRAAPAEPSGLDSSDSELDSLPDDLVAAIARLGDHRFQSSAAAEGFERLRRDAEDIRRLADFLRRYGKLFRGRESLGFDEALELIDRIEALKRLEDRLTLRDFDSIDLDEIAELLGEETASGIEQLAAMITALVEAGYLRPRGAHMELSPKGARRLGQIALREIHRGLVHDASGRHETAKRGPMEVLAEESKPYEYGDPFHIDVGASLRKALRRKLSIPFELDPRDLEVHESRHTARSATVLLLDMSWSMSWEGRFAAAKKVALAMDCLMRTRHPRDFFAIVGFYTRAVRIDPAELGEVTWNMGDPFTNLQDALRMGGDLLARERAANKRMIVITDGQPTAYFADGELFCEWPMSLGGLSTRATVETLREVARVTRNGIVINTFMLDDSPPLRAFVEKMTRINRGRAFYTTPRNLGHFLLVDHVGRKRRVL